MWHSDLSAYSDFCDRHRGEIPVFFAPWWLNAACGAGNWQPMITGDRTAVWPHFIAKKGPFRYVAMPPLTTRLGFWPATKVVSMAGLPRSMYAIQCLQPGATVRLAGKGARWKTFTYYAIAPGATRDTVWAKMNQLAKREIRKGNELLTLKKNASTSDLYRMIELRLERQQLKSPVSLSRLEAMVNAARDAGQGDVWTAVDAGGRVHAAGLLLWDARYCRYLAGGLDTRMSRTGAARWLLWQGIQFALDEDRGFDFGGGTVPEVGSVYASLGATERNYPRLQLYRPNWTAGLIQTVKKIYAPHDSRFH